MNAKQTIINLIRNKVAVMNIAFRENNEGNAEYLERSRHEVHGMLICLKNISSSNEFYNINYYESGYEFGYYDDDGKWWTIEN